ncbi:MAG: hypothetical protein Fur0039_05400 [Rhodocyclaceae bacterium]
MRAKSRWFAKGRAHSPEAAASVVAMTLWKLALATIRSMREAKFSIEAGPGYFAFLREYLVFLIHVADRYAYTRFDAAGRAAFTTWVARRLAELCAENEAELLGGDAGAAARSFIDTVNARGADYAVFGFDEKEGPDFGFGRYLGNRLLELVPPQDRSWVIDQVMAIEVPDAVQTLKSVFSGLEASSAKAAGPP